MKRSEHMAVRKTAGWYLWTHQLVEVKGEDAAIFLERLFTKPIATLNVGQERYTAMLDEKAEIIDDVVVFRMEENEFWVSTLFAPYLISWMNKHKGDANVEYSDITSKYHMYAVQGPKSKDMINSLVKENIDEVKFFTISDNEIDGVPVKINRAGFTGEKLGYDIYIQGKHLGGPGEVVIVDGEEVGRVSKIVYSYVQEKNIVYILSKKWALKIGDKVNIHGHEAIITERKVM